MGSQIYMEKNLQIYFLSSCIRIYSFESPYIKFNFGA